MSDFDTIVNLAKKRGFVFQSSEIYGGLRSAYDYGPLGVELLRNVKEQWWHAMVRMRDDVVGIELLARWPLADGAGRWLAVTLPHGERSADDARDLERIGRSEAVAPVKMRVPPPGSMRRAASRPTRKPPKQHTRQLCSK